MLRVLTLSTLFPNGHQPQLGLFVERQTRALSAREGVAVQVVAPVGLPLWPLSLHPHYRPLGRLAVSEDWSGLQVHRPRFTVWPVIGARRAGRSLAKALLPRLRALQRDFPFDVIDAEFFWPDGVAAMHLARALGVPFSVKARGSDIYHWGDVPDIGEQIAAAARAAAGLLAVSASLKDEMVLRGMPADKIIVHHTGADLGLFLPRDRAAAKAELGVTGPLLATVGGLIERKGQSFALEALALLPDATLLLIGDGPDRPQLERQAAQLGVAGRARFLGSQPPQEVARLAAAADVMLLPTRAEGLANAWVEALACGTPVVTCDAGGVRDVIDRPELGRIAARDGAALAAAVREVLAAAPDQQAVRRGAERFSWERNAAELEAHLRAVATSLRA
ncbi:MAG TPA: glycosyltransferase [Allosphingosinicella sp.]|nr:glycosyltransferase [Allosphingosinicella sp.]